MLYWSDMDAVLTPIILRAGPVGLFFQGGCGKRRGVP